MDNQIHIGVAGAAGNMGRMVMSELIRREQQEQGVQLVRAYERQGHPSMGVDAGVLCGRESRGVVLADDIEDFFKHSHVVIDFTSGETASLHSECAADTGTALVIGSTGIDEAAREAMREASERVAIVCAPNMSRGAHLLCELARSAARSLGAEYDAEILEVHHHHKQDAPSGIAWRLGQCVAEGRGDENPQYLINREGTRPKGSIGFSVSRGGSSFKCVHRLSFHGMGEVIEVAYESHTREVFAQGAVDAAVWAVSQNAGLYDMNDVIKHDAQ